MDRGLISAHSWCRPTRGGGAGYNAGMTEESVGHVPVLLSEVVELLAPRPGGVVLDCTLGRGGHAAAVLPLIGRGAEGTSGGGGGRYVGVDVDPGNAGFAEARLRPIAEAHGVDLEIVVGNFAEVAAPGSPRREALGLSGGVDAVLADLGFASNQMDDPGRGFSFMQDGPLDMRLSGPGRSAGGSADTPGSAAGISGGSGGGAAAGLVNTLPERELADLIYRYGEERLSRRIARKIVERRAQSPIETTGELAEICRRAYGPRAGKSKIHPATRTFQALRIAVNGELEALDALLKALPGLLKPGIVPGELPGAGELPGGGRAGVISFHSLEDRPVKQAFLKMQQDGLAQRLTRKPITAGPEEIAANPRSRSAKLRGIQRLPEAEKNPIH